MPPGWQQPPVPPDSDWIPARITAVLGGGQYLWTECWQTSGGVIADRIGGRVNSASDPGYAIDGSTFAVTAAGTAVQCLARRSVGAGGTQWELKGFAGGSVSYKSYEGSTDVGTFGTDTFLCQGVAGCSPAISLVFASGYIQVGAGGVTITLGLNYDAAPIGAVGLHSILQSLVLPANAYVPFSLLGFKPAASTTVNVLYKITAGSVAAVVASGVAAVPGTPL